MNGSRELCKFLLELQTQCRFENYFPVMKIKNVINNFIVKFYVFQIYNRSERLVNRFVYSLKMLS